MLIIKPQKRTEVSYLLGQMSERMRLSHPSFLELLFPLKDTSQLKRPTQTIAFANFHFLSHSLFMSTEKKTCEVAGKKKKSINSRKIDTLSIMMRFLQATKVSGTGGEVSSYDRSYLYVPSGRASVVYGLQYSSTL